LDDSFGCDNFDKGDDLTAMVVVAMFISNKLIVARYLCAAESDYGVDPDILLDADVRDLQNCAGKSTGHHRQSLCRIEYILTSQG